MKQDSFLGTADAPKLIIERNSIRVSEYLTKPNGDKWYEIRYVTQNFCHISYLIDIHTADQSPNNLLALAMGRFNL